MTSPRFTFQVLSGSFAEQQAYTEGVIADAAMGAMDSAALIVKRDGRADITAAGFSKKWANALRVNLYPSKGRSMSPAVFVWHKIQYAGIFEEGGTIRGDPMLWLPLTGTPRFIGRQRMTPERYAQSVGDLVSLPSKSGTPLLGARVRLSGSRLASARQGETPKLSLALLRRQGNYGGRGVLWTVPLFFGIPTANIRDKFSIREVCERVSGRLPALFAANFKDDGSA